MITNIVNGKSYIGQSENIYRRVNCHFAELRRGDHRNMKLQRSYDKYGEESFEIKVLELCDKELMNDAEIYYIARFNTCEAGFNILPGGDSRSGYTVSDEAREKMRKNHHDVSGSNNPMYGKTVYDFMTEAEIIVWKQHISEANTGPKNSFWGKKHTAETKNKISAANKGRLAGEKHPQYGKSLPIETRQKIRESTAWFHEQNTRGNSVTARKVVCLNTENVFECLLDACDEYRFNYTALSSCCSGQLKSCGEVDGVRLAWAYFDDYQKMSHEDVIGKVIAANSKPVTRNKRVRCVNTGVIYGSATEAASIYGIDKSSLCKVCRGINQSAGMDTNGEPLKWEYV